MLGSFPICCARSRGADTADTAKLVGEKPPARSFKACQDMQVCVRVRGEELDLARTPSLVERERVLFPQKAPANLGGPCGPGGLT